MGRRFLVSWVCAVGAVLALGTVLEARASAREFALEALPSQTLSNLFWAAWGLNRPDGRRTALNLCPTQLSVLAQTVGYPKK